MYMNVIRSLCSLPATNLNFTADLERATSNQIRLAIETEGPGCIDASVEIVLVGMNISRILISVRSASRKILANARSLAKNANLAKVARNGARICAGCDRARTILSVRTDQRLFLQLHTWIIHRKIVSITILGRCVRNVTIHMMQNIGRNQEKKEE